MHIEISRRYGHVSGFVKRLNVDKCAGKARRLPGFTKKSLKLYAETLFLLLLITYKLHAFMHLHKTYQVESNLEVQETLPFSKFYYLKI